MSDALQAKIDQIVDRYQPEIQRLEEEGRRIGDEAQDPNTVEAVIDVDFELDWKDHEVIFDIPTVTMRQRDLSLDLPRVTARRQRIVFDKPVVEMENRCLTKYPKIGKWGRVKMVCAYTKVPVVKMKRHEIIYDVPEVTMERREFSTKVPEFGMRPQRWVIRVPQITLKSIKAGAKKLEEKGQELERRGEDLSRRMTDEIQLLLAGSAGPAAARAGELRQQALAEFNDAIAALEKAISDLVAQGIDPIKVPGENGEVNLRKQLAELMAERDRMEAELDEMFAIGEEEEEEEEALEVA